MCVSVYASVCLSVCVCAYLCDGSVVGQHGGRSRHDVSEQVQTRDHHARGAPNLAAGPVGPGQRATQQAKGAQEENNCLKDTQADAHREREANLG